MASCWYSYYSFAGLLKDVRARYDRARAFRVVHTDEPFVAGEGSKHKVPLY